LPDIPTWSSHIFEKDLQKPRGHTKSYSCIENEQREVEVMKKALLCDTL
jgi:hypothetical protein